MASPAMKRLFLSPLQSSGRIGARPSRNAVANNFALIQAKKKKKMNFITKIALKSQNATKGCCEVD